MSTVRAPTEYGDERDVPVRFINTPNGKDVEARAFTGANLLRVADKAGVEIPRGCLSGLCGSCTSDIVMTERNGGTQMVRACQTGVAVAPDETEMVVDCARAKKFMGKLMVDPMARFNDMDTDYVAGAAPIVKGRGKVRACEECNATGDIGCYGCAGVKLLDSERGGKYPCPLCSGTGMLRCSRCQAVGSYMV